MRKLILSILVLASAAYAGTTRTIEGDQIKSSDHTKTWVMPGVSGTLANTAEIAAHEADTTNIHGIADTSLLATKSYADSAVSTHEADTTNVHGITDTSLLLTTTNTKTVTNKDIDGGTASNTSRLTLPKDTTTNLSSLTRKQGSILYDTTLNKPVYDNGSNLITVGSGVGSSINYITNGGGEQDTSGWAAYSDAQTATITIASPGVITVGSTTGMSVGDRVVFTTSSALPTGLTASTIYYISSVVSSTTLKVSATLGGSDVNTSGTQSGTHTLRPLKPIDGTGGSPALSINRTTGVGAALRDDDSDGVTASLYVDKGVITDVAGEGVSYDFTLAKADYSPSPKMQTIAFDYYGQSNFVYGSSTTDSDLEVWIYARDTGVLIQPGVFKLDGSGKFVAQFQPLTTDSNYRLILHEAQTHSNAWSWYFDSVAVGPQNIARGPPISDWVSYTPTGTWVSNATYTGQWRRAGDTMEVIVNVTCSGAPTSAALSVTLPSGYSIDTNKISATADNYTFGITTVLDSGVISYSGNVGYASTTTMAAMTHNASATYTQNFGVTQAVPITFGASDAVRMHFWVPISGWSSNTQNVIDEGRTVVVEYSGNAGGAQTGGTTNIDFTTKSRDSHSAFSGTVFTAPLPGDYQFSGNVQLSAGVAETVDLYVNGSQRVRLGGQASTATSSHSFAGQTYLNAGDTASLRLASNATLTNNAVSHRLTIHRIAGPSLPQPTETVAARYTTVAGQTCTTGSTCILNFGTMDYDTHGAVTTGASWKFTAPNPGKFRVIAGFTTDAATAVTPTQLQLFKNGSLFDQLDYRIAPASSRVSAYGTTEINLIQGDYIDTRWINGDSNTRTMINSAGFNHIEIIKVGN
jgi:hypothetical protein